MKKAVIFIFLLFISTLQFASSVLFTQSTKSVSLVGQNIDFVSIKTIEGFSSKLNFQQLQTKGVSLPNTQDYYILKINIVNQSSDSSLILTSAIPYLEHFEAFHLVNNQRIYLTKIKDSYPQFELPKNKNINIYLEIKSSKQFNIPLRIELKEQSIATGTRRSLLVGSFLGIMICMFLYNIIIGIYTKQKNYIYYILYILFISLAQIRFLGVELFPYSNSLFLRDSLLFLGSAFSGIFGTMFALNFLEIKKRLPMAHKMFITVIMVYVVTGILFLFGYKLLAYNFIQLGGLLSAIVFLFSCISLIRKNVQAAKIYLAAWFFLMLGLVVYSLRDFGILEATVLVNMTFPLGVAIETVLLSLALGNNINILRKEKEVANDRVLKEVKKNEELVRNQNIDLELRVKNRTAELETALEELKAAQSQLVQSEKMASLGVLTAGIAHEINNPINFVSANVVPLREDIEVLSLLLTEYKNLNPQNVEQELARILKLEEEHELDYILEETQLLINGIEEGAKRTHTIVDGLKTFSRGDAGNNSAANINSGILGTLSVLKSKLKHINLVKNLSEDIPLIECQIGKLNQVFLNLLNNALDALEEKNGPNSKESNLTITSYVKNKHVFIEFKDDAKGISKENQENIFEPFFTTKDIGKGTGLGLAISFGIIEEHNGELYLHPIPEKGSTFVVKLPL